MEDHAALVLNHLRSMAEAFLRTEARTVVEEVIASALPLALRHATAKEHLTRAEAADYIGVSVRKLDYLRSSGKLGWSKRGGRVLVLKADLDEYVGGGYVPARATESR